MAYFWLRAVVRMWNRAVAMPRTSLLACAMRENLRLSQGSSSGALWCRQVERVLGSVHRESQQLPGVLQQLRSFQQLEVPAVLRAFNTCFYQQWSDLPVNPRTADGSRVVFASYDRWLAPCPFSELDLADPGSWCPKYVDQSAGLNREHLGSLSRFRLGAHDLRVCTGRWQRPPLPRGARVCQRPGCDLGSVEDEFHMLFECPFYAPVRERFACLFEAFGGVAQHWVSITTCTPDSGQMAAFMDQHPALVAAFVHACYLLRCHPDSDPELILSSSALVHAMEVSEEFFSVSGSDEFYSVSEISE